MERVVVTSGEGVGGLIVRTLQARGVEALVIQDILAANIRELFSAFHPDTVIHTAVSAVSDVADNARYNVLGTIGLLEAARLSGAKHFIFASTTAVDPKPTTLLSVAKLTGERYCNCYRTVHGLPCTVVRLADDQDIEMQAKALLSAAESFSTVSV